MFEELIKQINAHDRIIIHRHKNPDGDAIGSQAGLKHLILDNFQDKEVYSVGDEAGKYGFIEGSELDEIPDEYYNGALAIILDSGSSSLIADERYKLAKKTIKIDHHVFCEKYADLEIVDTSFESCCGEIALFAKESGLKLSPVSAAAIYTGMVTDSGRFRFDSVSSRTFELAAFLLTQPIKIEKIYSNLYVDEFASVKRRAYFVQRIQFTDKNVAYLYNTEDDVLNAGMSAFAVSRSMVGVMGEIKGVDVWVNFTESTGEGILCELRSSRFNINPVAVKYGGGGHKKASGAIVQTMDEVNAMLADLGEVVEEGIELD